MEISDYYINTEIQSMADLEQASSQVLKLNN